MRNEFEIHSLVIFISRLPSFLKIWQLLNLSDIFRFVILIGDSRIISGESGAVTLGALHHICTKNEAMRKQLELDETSRILLVSTEGDTDPDGFRQIVLQEGQ